VKILLDTCVWGGAVHVLQEAGYDVVWAGDWIKDPGDQEILAFAFSEDRILVTLDKDFGELAVLQGQSHRGIIRIAGFSAKSQPDVCKVVLEQHGDDLIAGAIITAEPGRLRIRST